MTVQRNEPVVYREFLMKRGNFDPRDFGVDMDRSQFSELMVDNFAETFRDSLTIDELCLRPTAALKFCNDVRQRYHYFDVPDDIILRSVMNARKNN